jgi:peptidoglycan LD-endopeptidase CwlK
MAIDSRSAKNIATLNKKVQPLATKLIEVAVAQGIHVKVISGHRTYEEQNKLYAQGRTKPGMIVTKAKGGYSNHNFGTAFDIGIFSENGKAYLDESPDYKRCGLIGESLGLEWGGNWKGFKDEPHFQYNQGRTMAQLRAAYDEHGDALT